MALSDRLKRLEGDHGPALCAERPCAITVHTERLLLPGGREETIGDPPPALCSSCPERANPRPRTRHVEVVLDHRGRFGSGEPHAEDAVASPGGAVAASKGPGNPAATFTAETPAGDPRADADLPIPPGWGPDHPGHPDYREDSAPRRRRTEDLRDGGPRL